jgi:hypothetical protein
MMNERIRELAKQAAAVEGWGPEVWQTTFTEKFAALVAAHEREACARVCEDLVAQYDLHSNFICAKAIRARGGE